MKCCHLNILQNGQIFANAFNFKFMNKQKGDLDMGKYGLGYNKNYKTYTLNTNA